MTDVKAGEVGRYGSVLEAEIDQGRLESAGIPARVRRDDCGGMYPQLVMHKPVRLEVDVADAERALEILGEAADAPPTPAWTCSCGETVEQGYDACWKCGAGRSSD